MIKTVFCKDCVYRKHIDLGAETYDRCKISGYVKNDPVRGEINCYYDCKDVNKNLDCKFYTKKNHWLVEIALALSGQHTL